MSNPSNTDRLKSLTRQEATVLYWKCNDWRYAKIAVKLGYSEDRINQIMSSVYKKLGFRKEMHWTERTRLLSQAFCPEFKAVINGQYANIENWPLYGEGITEELRQEEPKADPEITALVLYDESRLVATEKEVVQGEVVDEPIVISRPQPVRRIGTGTVVAGVSVTGLLCIGAICIGGGLLYLLTRPTSASNPPAVVSTSIIEIHPTTSLKSTVLPDTAAVTEIPKNATEAAVPPAASAPFVPPVDGILFQDNFDNGMSPDWHIYTGKWIVANGKLTKLQEDPYSTVYDWIGLEEPEWKNYIVSFTINEIHPTTEEPPIALAVRDNTTESKYIGLELDFWPHIYLSLIANDSANSSPIAGQNKDFDFPIKTDVQVEIEAKGNNYTLRVSGQQVQTVTIPGYDSGGIKLGLHCSNYPGCPSFDDFKVTYLP